MSEQTLTELIYTLTREAELFEEFLEQLDNQRDAIVTNDIDRLNNITAAQQDKLATSQALEQARTELVRRLSTENEISGDITVSRLLEVVSKENGRKLTQLRDTILDLHEKIETARSRNGMLLDKSREIVRETLRLMNRIGESAVRGAEYGPGSSSDRGAAGTRMRQDRVSLALDRRV